MKATIGNPELVTIRRESDDSIIVIYHLGRGYAGSRHPGSFMHALAPEAVLLLSDNGKIRIASPSRAWPGRHENYRAISILELRSMVLDRATRVRRGLE